MPAHHHRLILMARQSPDPGRSFARDNRLFRYGVVPWNGGCFVDYATRYAAHPPELTAVRFQVGDQLVSFHTSMLSS